MIKPQVNRYYQHRYGGLYKMQDIALSTEDKSMLVVYVHCYPFQYQTWVRPHDEWCDGRFRLLEDDEYNALLKKDKITFQNEITAAKELAKGK